MQKGAILQETISAFFHRSLCDSFSSIGRIYGSRKQKEEGGISSLNVIPNDPLRHFVFVVPATLDSVGFSGPGLK